MILKHYLGVSYGEGRREKRKFIGLLGQIFVRIERLASWG